MLQPSENFTADQIRFLQNEATEWIQKANDQIIEAANNGKREVHIDITGGSAIGNKFYYAPDALIGHFKKRGFNVRSNGQSSIIIDWKTEIHGELTK